MASARSRMCKISTCEEGPRYTRPRVCRRACGDMHMAGRRYGERGAMQSHFGQRESQYSDVQRQTGGVAAVNQRLRCPSASHRRMAHCKCGWRACRPCVASRWPCSQQILCTCPCNDAVTHTCGQASSEARAKKCPVHPMVQLSSALFWVSRSATRWFTLSTTCLLQLTCAYLCQSINRGPLPPYLLLLMTPLTRRPTAAVNHPFVLS